MIRGEVHSAELWGQEFRGLDGKGCNILLGLLSTSPKPFGRFCKQPLVDSSSLGRPKLWPTWECFTHMLKRCTRACQIRRTMARHGLNSSRIALPSGINLWTDCFTRILFWIVIRLTSLSLQRLSLASSAPLLGLCFLLLKGWHSTSVSNLTKMRAARQTGTEASSRELRRNFDSGTCGQKAVATQTQNQVLRQITARARTSQNFSKVDPPVTNVSRSVKVAEDDLHHSSA